MIESSAGGRPTGGRKVLVAGVDEAGRGPWAGPVVAAAVILGSQIPPGLTDSKRLSGSRREALFARLLQGDGVIAFAAASARRVDERNVLRATLQAMRAAVEALAHRPDVVHVDGRRPIPDLGLEQRLLVGGDARCPAISAASVVAKVVRDRMMTAWDRAYPPYGFRRHKGYGTAEHADALAAYGPCPLHRYSFAPVRARSLFSGPLPDRKNTAN